MAPSQGRIVHYVFRNAKGEVVQRPAMVIDVQGDPALAVARCTLAVMVQPSDVNAVAEQGQHVLMQYLYVEGVPNMAVRCPPDAHGPIEEYAGKWMPGYWHWPEVQQAKFTGTGTEPLARSM
jgi:hypothetical protein